MRDPYRVKRWYYVVLGAILLGGIVYMFVHRQDLGLVSSPGATPASTSSVILSPAATDQGGTAVRPPHIVWIPINRAKEGFQIEMPSDTKEMQIPAYNESGGTDRIEMLSSYPDANTSFSVAWADEPPVERVSGSAEKTLDTARDEALARTQSVLVSESKVNRLGYPARDFVGRNEGGGIFNARLILAGRRLYMLIAAFPAASARRDQDVTHFFNSFRVTAKD